MLKLNDFYLDYLWAHNICVSDNANEDVNPEEMIATIELLASNYGIVIREGKTLAGRYIYGFIEGKLSGKNVPEAFYRGFPQSVRNLSKEELLIDQLYHYYQTYGLDNFEGDAGHSVFEQEVIRTALKADVEPKYVDILTEKQAIEKLNDYFDGVLASTRPFNTAQTEFVLKARVELEFDIKNVASKDTTMNLLLATRDLRFAKFMSLTDVPKFVEKILANSYIAKSIPCRYSTEMVVTKKSSLTNLNLNSADRKFVTKIIQILLDKSNQKTLDECLEKKKVWCGLLHHIHYKPRNIDEQFFVNSIRSNRCKSALSDIERCMNEGNPVGAAKNMKRRKGSSYVLRNLNYLLSRCKTDDEVSQIIEELGADANPIVMMQLAMSYENDTNSSNARSFSFNKMNKMKHHTETVEEFKRRKSFVDIHSKNVASKAIYSLIEQHYQGKLTDKKVYISEEMKNIALPIYNATGETGFGILPTGSRIPFDAKVIRAFTYWEKVNDIDLSVIGISADAKQSIEFSWRTMYGKQGEDITFSGDETRGYKGGSEFFDIDLQKFRMRHKNIRYLLFSNNVFSGSDFKDCYCTAGFMSRDDADAGQVYEPKTVKTSYRINCESTFARLFAIDLATNELIWLNMVENDKHRIAGCGDTSWLIKYLNVANTLNYFNLFSNLASNITIDASDADIVVSDEVGLELKEGATMIHSYDIEAVMKCMNL